jgi:hypothetical protein
LRLRCQQLRIVALRAGPTLKTVRQPAPVGAFEFGDSAQQAGLDLVTNQLRTSQFSSTTRSFASSAATTRRLALRTAQSPCRWHA